MVMMTVMILIDVTVVVANVIVTLVNFASKTMYTIQISLLCSGVWHVLHYKDDHKFWQSTSASG